MIILGKKKDLKVCALIYVAARSLLGGLVLDGCCALLVLCIFFDLKLHASNLINIELGFQYSSLFGSIGTHLY